jgi:uncharacterized protein (DUF58 family)
MPGPRPKPALVLGTPMALVKDRPPPSIYTTLLLQLMTGVFCFIALLNRQRDLVLLTLLILVIMAGARMWSRISLRGLRVHAQVDRSKIFPGERLALGVSVENRKWLPVHVYLEMFAANDLPPTEGSNDFSYECGLLWHQTSNFQWHFCGRRRGVFQLGPVQAVAGDALGFYLNTEKAYRPPIDIVVYPKLVPLKPITFPRKDFFGLPGAKSPVLDPIYILGTRDYQHCQPARYIHWKASARHNRLQEKVFEPSSQAKLLFLVDVGSFAERHARDDFERALEVVASLMVHCDRSGFALGFSTNGLVRGGGADIPVSRGSQKLSVMLEVLARLEIVAQGSLRDHLRLIEPLPRGLSVMSFGYEENGETQALREFFAYRTIPLIQVVSRSDAESRAGLMPSWGSLIALRDLQMTQTNAQAMSVA